MPGRSLFRLKRRRVALLVETSNSYGRGLLEGIIDYMRDHQPWSVSLVEQRRGEAVPAELARWNGDGIIARIENPNVARWVRSSRLPAVDVSAGRLLPGVPWVETDDDLIAEAAFTHLAERGFRNFGFAGDPRFNWSRWRQQAFVARAARAGCAAPVLELAVARRRGAPWHRRRERLLAWLDALPRPCGVMACYDIVAQQLLDACRSGGIAVPEEIAVVGVDNDELLCRLSDPPLSSVAPGTRRTGYEAAALLDRMMNGERPGAVATRVPPVAVVARQSTDVLAINDRHVADALRFIRQHAFEDVTVADVIRHSPLTRRVLESRFKRILGRTPHEELVRTRLTRVKQLLLETELSIADIAERAGYQHSEYLSAQFHREVGLPPSRFRALHRPEARHRG